MEGLYPIIIIKEPVGDRIGNHLPKQGMKSGGGRAKNTPKKGTLDERD